MDPTMMTPRYCVFAIALSVSAVSCDINRGAAGHRQSANLAQASVSPTSSHNPQVERPFPVVPTAQIRKVDFKNFTYAWYPRDYTPPHGDRKITLHDGEIKVEASKNTDRLWASLANVSYRDLTGDSAEDAIVTVTTNFDPNGSVACIFIYTIRGDKPKLLWSHETGDRANGGLRSLRVEGFDLVVEQYDLKFDSGEGVYEEGAALCCPKRFIRSHYRWNGEHFEKTRSESLPNEYDNARFLGYPS